MTMRWNTAVQRGKMGTSKVKAPHPTTHGRGATDQLPDDTRKEATEMGVMSIVVGVLLFLIPGACLYVGYMTDSGRM